MTRLDKIEDSIADLADDEFWKLAEWFAERQAERWERRIEVDSAAGKLDDIISAARAEIAAGKVRPL